MSADRPHPFVSPPVDTRDSDLERARLLDNRQPIPLPVHRDDVPCLRCEGRTTNNALMRWCLSCGWSVKL